jgi:hypothetical protein
MKVTVAFSSRLVKFPFVVELVSKMLHCTLEQCASLCRVKTDFM